MIDWPVQTLGDLIAVQNGYAFDSKYFSSAGKIGLIRIRDLKSGVDTETRYDGPFSHDYIVSAGDYLIGMDGEFRCYEWKGEPALLNQRVCRLQGFSTTLESRFLFYGINKFLKDIEDATGYTTVKHLSSKSILGIQMPVPPLDEQQRIVALLDDATARITELTACYEQARAHANDLFTSALRDSLESNHDWPVKALGDICELVSRGRPPSYCEVGGVVVLNQKCVRNGKIDFGQSRRTDNRAKEIPSWAYLCEGDTLINSTGTGTLGRASFVSKLTEPTTFDTHLTVVRPLKDICSPAFIGLVLSNREVDIIELASGTTGQTELPREAVRSFEIPIPPLEEQKRIVSRMDQMRAKTAEMVAAYDAKLQAAKNLRQSILEAAFAGEL